MERDAEGGHGVGARSQTEGIPQLALDGLLVNARGD